MISKRASSSWPPTLTSEQQRLLGAIWGPFSETGQWPIFDYVGAVCENAGFDAAYAIRTLPPICHSYDLISHSRMGPPLPDTEIALTIAGMSFVDSATWLVAQFFLVLEGVAKKWRSVPSNPGTPRSLILTYGDLVHLLSPPVEARVVRGVQKVLPHEPSTWSGITEGDPEAWRWNVSSTVARFLGTSSMSDYVRRIEELLVPDAAGLGTSEAGASGMEDEDGLTRYLGSIRSSENWNQLAREAVVFLEDRLRRLSDTPFAPGSVEVVNAILHPSKGTYPLSKDVFTESEGWHLLVLGLFKAIRNPLGHRLNSIKTEQEGLAVVELVRLILGRLRVEYPSLDKDINL